MTDCKFCLLVEPQFQDLSGCIRHIELRTRGKNVLFRGEACCYPKTSPGLRRLFEDPALDYERRCFLLNASMIFVEWFCEETGVHEAEQAEMFLQHYGLPTDLLDFSSSLAIAAYFACKERPDHVGRIGVIDRELAQNHLDIFELSNFELAPGLSLVRPARQHAFAVRHHPGHPSDFQDSATCQSVGLEWFSFRKVVSDQTLFAGMERILDSTDDPCAQYMREWLGSFAGTTENDAGVAQEMVNKISRCL